MHLVAVVFGWGLIPLFQHMGSPSTSSKEYGVVNPQEVFDGIRVYGMTFYIVGPTICILQFLQHIIISELSPGTFITNAYTSLARADRLQLWCQLQNCGELEERASSAASLEPRNSWLELCCYLKKALNSQSSHWGTLGRNLQRFRGI